MVRHRMYYVAPDAGFRVPYLRSRRPREVGVVVCSLLCRPWSGLLWNVSRRIMSPLRLGLYGMVLDGYGAHQRVG